MSTTPYLKLVTPDFPYVTILLMMGVNPKSTRRDRVMMVPNKNQMDISLLSNLDKINGVTSTKFKIVTSIFPQVVKVGEFHK